MIDWILAGLVKKPSGNVIYRQPLLSRRLFHRRSSGSDPADKESARREGSAVRGCLSTLGELILALKGCVKISSAQREELKGRKMSERGMLGDPQRSGLRGRQQVHFSPSLSVHLFRINLGDSVNSP